ncbi:MAG: HDOD domain-containing protein [Gammaproteobacteria bacterium]|nr:HDOD domain-containing protein [Gammaproteobacteria bacterium]
MTTVSIEQILTRSSELSSLPESVAQLNELMQKENVNISEISDIVSSDPVLSARILKTVNSPFYAFPTTIDTIAYAVTILGIDSIRYLAVTSTVISNFAKHRNSIFPLESFWRHSFATAVIAQQLSKAIKSPQQERLFTCGLLHELGGLLIGMSEPDLYRQIISNANQNKTSMSDAEKELLGFTHYDVTAALLDLWRLPVSISQTIKHIQHPEQNQLYVQDSAVLSIADAVASAIFPSIRLIDHELKLESRNITLAGVKAHQLNQILDELDNLVDGAMQGLLIDMAA